MNQIFKTMLQSGKTPTTEELENTLKKPSKDITKYTPSRIYDRTITGQSVFVVFV